MAVCTATPQILTMPKVILIWMMVYLEVAENHQWPDGQTALACSARSIGKVDTHTQTNKRKLTFLMAEKVIWYHQEVIYFTTKGDDRVWAYDIRDNDLSIILQCRLFIFGLLLNWCG